VDNTLLYGKSAADDIETVRDFVVGVGYN